MTRFKPPLPASLWPALQRLAGQERWPPQTDVEAQALIERAVTDDLLPILMDDEDVPAIVRERLQGMSAWRRLQDKRVELMANAFRRLAAIMEGEPFIVIKGMDYAYRLFPEPRHRLSRDIDILIPTGRMRTVSQRLLQAGLSSGPVPRPSSELTSYYERSFRLDGITFDVHQAFVQRARNDIDYDAVWSAAVPSRVAGVSALRLSDADAIFYQAFSFAIHELHQPVNRYLDLERMMAGNESGVARAAEKAARWNARNGFFAGVRQTQRIFPHLDTPGIRAVLDDLLPANTRSRIEREVLPDPAEAGAMKRPLERGKQLRRKRMLLDDPYHRLRFIAYHVCADMMGRAIRLQRRLKNAKTPPLSDGADFRKS
jgi:hypothetical protein